MEIVEKTIEHARQPAGLVVGGDRQANRQVGVALGQLLEALDRLPYRFGDAARDPEINGDAEDQGQNAHARDHGRGASRPGPHLVRGDTDPEHAEAVIAGLDGNDHLEGPRGRSVAARVIGHFQRARLELAAVQQLVAERRLRGRDDAAVVADEEQIGHGPVELLGGFEQPLGLVRHQDHVARSERHVAGDDLGLLVQHLRERRALGIDEHAAHQRDGRHEDRHVRHDQLAGDLPMAGAKFFPHGVETPSVPAPTATGSGRGGSGSFALRPRRRNREIFWPRPGARRASRSRARCKFYTCPPGPSRAWEQPRPRPGS